MHKGGAIHSIALQSSFHFNTHSKDSRSCTVFRLLLESGLRAVPTEGDGEAVANNVVHAAGMPRPSVPQAYTSWIWPDRRALVAVLAVAGYRAHS